ncbi:uncharacterized protein LOC120846418 [Ixodes scapularis]|uniref:Putative secreted salivary protein n=1 Tax=Ixodes scapularis TaxID=6945 RepID=Q4PN42_IXOSC|nr:uncharacterized protein LOC120846418 [Ixodes scapularis]AAY66568.1 putative secreted salivary protein [Ixodes scapularis]
MQRFGGFSPRRVAIKGVFCLCWSSCYSAADGCFWQASVEPDTADYRRLRAWPSFWVRFERAGSHAIPRSLVPALKLLFFSFFLAARTFFGLLEYRESAARFEVDQVRLSRTFHAKFRGVRPKCDCCAHARVNRPLLRRVARCLNSNPPNVYEI